MLIFDDDSENDWNRQKVLERLSPVNLPQGLNPQMGPDFSPVGQILLAASVNLNPDIHVGTGFGLQCLRSRHSIARLMTVAEYPHKKRDALFGKAHG
jgi:Cu/Ag efflux pump CusA